MQTQTVSQERCRRAFDRGAADAYYHRQPNPRIWTDDCGVDEDFDLSEQEISAYIAGMRQEEDRKEFY